MPEATRPSPRDRGGERARLVALPGGRADCVRRSSLPSQVSSFVGREEELGEVVQLLHAHRLVTPTASASRVLPLPPAPVR
jgi:hypothetical protein